MVCAGPGDAQGWNQKRTVCVALRRGDAICVRSAGEWGSAPAPGDARFPSSGGGSRWSDLRPQSRRFVRSPAVRPVHLRRENHRRSQVSQRVRRSGRARETARPGEALQSGSMAQVPESDEDCLRQSPHDRPSSAQVFERLNCADMLCLLNELVLPSNADCVVVSAGPEPGPETCHESAPDSGPEPGLAPGSGPGSGPVAWLGGGSSSKRQGNLSAVNLESGSVQTQLIDSSPVLCLALVPSPQEHGCDWLVAGSQSGSLFVQNTRDWNQRHRLQSVSDAVTSLFFHQQHKHTQRRSYLLVGTADGALTVYEDSALQVEGAEPVKTLSLGSLNTPVQCLCQSSVGQSSLCGRPAALRFCRSRLITTFVKPSTPEPASRESLNTSDLCFFLNFHFTHSSVCRSRSRSLGGEACISRLAVDKLVYVSKVGACSVEVWDRRSERLVDSIDCAQVVR
ncbi:hypothetical protein WMY93_032215 [Mugilogobius chulae]|uniref:LRRK2 beta-propeller domain-containing protein n=1 Tax=Mugilogobius chulae TaxID=88201 RepID=A0AAW0MEI3_9GOBI